MVGSQRESLAEFDLHSYLHARDSALVHHLLGPAHGRLLDVGSGEGADLRLLEGKGWSVVGIDPAIRGGRTRCVKGVGERLPFRNGSFHAATCILVLPHVRFPSDLVREVHRVLRRGGRAAFVVFSSSPLNLRVAVARYTFSHGSDRLTPRLYSLNGVRRLMASAGFQTASCQGSDFLPWMTGILPRRLRSRFLRTLDHVDRRLSRGPLGRFARKIIVVGVRE